MKAFDNEKGTYFVNFSVPFLDEVVQSVQKYNQHTRLYTRLTLKMF